MIPPMMAENWTVSLSLDRMRSGLMLLVEGASLNHNNIQTDKKLDVVFFVTPNQISNMYRAEKILYFTYAIVG